MTGALEAPSFSFSFAMTSGKAPGTDQGDGGNDEGQAGHRVVELTGCRLAPKPARLIAPGMAHGDAEAGQEQEGSRVAAHGGSLAQGSGSLRWNVGIKDSAGLGHVFRPAWSKRQLLMQSRQSDP